VGSAVILHDFLSSSSDAQNMETMEGKSIYYKILGEEGGSHVRSDL